MFTDVKGKTDISNKKLLKKFMYHWDNKTLYYYLDLIEYLLIRVTFEC